MKESYRFRTGSGRIVVLVPDHAVRPVDGRENAWRESAIREHPFGRSALGRARDDGWRSPGSRDTYTIDLGMLPMPGRALGFEKPGDLVMPPWDDIPFLRDLVPKRGAETERDTPAPAAATPATAVDPSEEAVPNEDELVFDFEDVTFGNERAVLLPEPVVDHRIDSQENSERGLSAVAAVLLFARNHPDHRLWIAGHTDAVGTGESDIPLSQARAESVRLVLIGEFDQWAEHAMTVYAVEDLQRVLTWAARTFGWDCDPGSHDNDLGPRTVAALGEFRKQSSAELSVAPIEADGVVAADWRAIAGLYDRVLAKMLPDDPTALRATVRELEGSPMSVGAEHSRRPPADAAVEGTERRVELVFVSPRAAATNSAQTLPEAVYRAPKNRLRYIAPAGRNSALTWVGFRLVHAQDGRPIAGRIVRLRESAGVGLERSTGADGSVTFAALPSTAAVDVDVLGGQPSGTVDSAPFPVDEIDDGPSSQGATQPAEAADEPAAPELLEVADDTDIEPEPPEPEPPQETPADESDEIEVDDDDIRDDDDAHDRGIA